MGERSREVRSEKSEGDQSFSGIMLEAVDEFIAKKR